MRRILATLVFLACWLAAGPALAQDVRECTEPGYFDRYLVDGISGRCELVAHDTIRWNGHSARIRMIRVVTGGPVNRAAADAGLHEVALSAGRALSRLGPDAMIDNVTILLGDAVSPRGAGGWNVEAGAFGAWTPDIVDGDCPIYLFKQSLARSGDYAVEVMVHELFHCVQHRLWGFGVRAEGWMSEGSAEYFVDLARPGRSSPGIDAFDSHIGSTSLGAMTYEANPFFLWYGDVNRPPAFLRFVAGQRPIGAMIDPAMWQAFAKAYFDNRIHMPEGSAMPSHPAIEELTVTASTRLQFESSAPYTLKGKDISFKQPKRYHLVMPPLSPEFFVAWRGAGGGDWGEAPADIDTGCKDMVYRVIWGGTAGSERADASVTARPGPVGGCRCPVGVWQETPESTRRYFEQSGLGAYGGGVGKRYVGGTRVLTLNPDHTGSFSYNGVNVITGEGTDLVLDQVQTGTSQFTWKIVNGMILTMVTRGTNVLTLNNTMRGHGGARHETRTSAMQSIGHTFSCDDTGLHLRVAAHRPSYLPAGMPTSSFSADMDFQSLGDAH